MNCREFTEFLHEYLFNNLPAGPERRVFFQALVAPDRSHATNLRRPGMLEVGPRSGLGGGPCVDANPAR